MLSEIIQAEKDIYCICHLYVESQKEIKRANSEEQVKWFGGQGSGGIATGWLKGISLSVTKLNKSLRI